MAENNFPAAVLKKYDVHSLQPTRTIFPGTNNEIDLSRLKVAEADELAKRYPQYFSKRPKGDKQDDPG